MKLVEAENILKQMLASPKRNRIKTDECEAIKIGIDQIRSTIDNTGFEE